MPNVHVHLLPSLVEVDSLERAAVVVVDVLRASTTIITALAAGARQIVPCLEIDDARSFRNREGTDVLLAGERGGLAIAGFDLGNSPEEFTADKVGGKVIALTTTNGTKAMMQCGDAARVYVGAFVNFSAVCERLTGEESVSILCAGTGNQITREDVLFAGAVANELKLLGGDAVELNDQAHIASDAWRQTSADFSTGKPLAEFLRSSFGGKNLMEIGLERDIDIAAQIDRFNIVPELNRATWSIS